MGEDRKETSIYDEPVAASTIAALRAGVERRRLNGKITTLESFIPHLIGEIERLRVSLPPPPNTGKGEGV